MSTIPSKFKVTKDAKANDLVQYIVNLYSIINKQYSERRLEDFYNKEIKDTLESYLRQLENGDKSYIKRGPDSKIKVYIGRYAAFYATGWACSEFNEIHYPYGDLKEKLSILNTQEVGLKYSTVVAKLHNKYGGWRKDRMSALTILLNFPELLPFVEFDNCSLPKLSKSNYIRWDILDKTEYTKEVEQKDKENLTTLAALAYL